MKIVEIDLSKIKVDDSNIKEHPEWHIKQIANSIKEFGFNDPLAIDENNILIEGHGRYEALKLLGIKKISVIKLSHLTETQKKAYIIAHNKLTLNTDFDSEKLLLSLNELVENNFDLSITGFDETIFDTLNNSYIDILEKEGFTAYSEDIKKTSDMFSITFNFPKKYEELINKKLKEKTKKYYTDLIIEFMKKEEKEDA